MTDGGRVTGGLCFDFLYFYGKHLEMNRMFGGVNARLFKSSGLQEWPPVNKMPKSGITGGAQYK